MSSIEGFIKERGITRLCHFTKSNKLLHLLRNESGIVANTFLDDQLDILEKNDEHRFDGREDFVCCSVEYPNTWYLRKIKDKDPIFQEWVILFINPNLILDSNTLFCHRNAAANYGAYIKGGEEGFFGMYKNPVQGKSLLYRSNDMLACSPTDDQAEVLIYKNIARSDIIGIATPTLEQAGIEKSRLSFIREAPQNISWFVAPELFDVKCSNMIRNGQRPTETPFLGE